MRAATFDEQEQVWTQTVAYKEWYSVREVCVLLQTGGPSVYGAIRRGTLKAYKVNGFTRVKHEDLVAYIIRRQAGATTVMQGALQIEEILPQKLAEKAAQGMTPAGEFEEEAADLSFLEE